MAFKIHYSAEAEANLEDILDWLLNERQAGEVGLRWFQGLRESIKSLAGFPERCSRAPESESLPF